MGEERRKVSKYKNTTDMYMCSGRHAPYTMLELPNKQTCGWKEGGDTISFPETPKRWQVFPRSMRGGEGALSPQATAMTSTSVLQAFCYMVAGSTWQHERSSSSTSSSEGPGAFQCFLEPALSLR